MKKIVFWLASGLALTGVTGCIGGGGQPTGPNEFRVVKKAPLVVPPDYNLRPPTPGQAQPLEVDPARAGIASSFGATIGVDASASERNLVAAAGATSVSPIIREQVDYEEARVIRKSTTVSDQIMDWREGDEVTDSATGDEPVSIERGSGSRLKLPGT